MNDTMVTVVGNVVDSPRRVRLENTAVTNFRMASTARRYDAGKQEFVDSGTFWVDVECWNGLSSNVSGSISKGDPVIVHGTLTTHSWETENGRRSTPRVKAFAVGPNLARGTAEFTRDRPARPDDAAGGAPTSQPTGTPDDQFLPDRDVLVRGRDYEQDEETLQETDPADSPSQPAHV